MKPADEVAEDVLESFPDVDADSEPPETPLSPDEGKFPSCSLQFVSLISCSLWPHN